MTSMSPARNAAARDAASSKKRSSTIPSWVGTTPIEREDLEALGIIFTDMDTAVREYPDLEGHIGAEYARLDGYPVGVVQFTKSPAWDTGEAKLLARVIVPAGSPS